MNIRDLSILVSSIAGILVSLAATYWPWFAKWYYGDAVKPYRGLIMLGFGALASVGIWVVSCPLAWFPGLVGCDNALRDLLIAFVTFVLANQATYQVSPVSPTRVKLGLDNC